nr:ATP-binding protein [Kibdelosporangium sp. MJ126-NF4]CEL20828.1 probable regulatory protein [Kibdelosporangium sp. MJ126-NF4]CTQ98367.1 probable regulatory protein [Kibdelosporangium sp. MJ126-NF4]
MGPRQLADVVSEDTLADIMLVVVELVTNAEVHTRSPRSLVISHWRDTVRIEVTDGDPALPVLHPPSTTRLGGRGIYIVDALSADWGVRRSARGKSVWSLFGSVTPKH